MYYLHNAMSEAAIAYQETGYSATEWVRAGVMHPVIYYSTEFIDIAIANQNAAKRLDFESSQERASGDARFPQRQSTILPQISP
jgi:hypothetical protein